jgi:hypothetical protein
MNAELNIIKFIKTIFVLLLILLNPFIIKSQDSSEEKKPEVEVVLRGKALGVFIIEDVWVRSFSFGTELRFNKRFSFTADIVHLRWRYEREVHDLPDPEQYSEYSYYDPRNYLAFELRYYPKFGDDLVGAKPYVNLFSKIGKRREYGESKFPFKDGAEFSAKSSFFDVGTCIGAQIGELGGVDVNFGAAYRSEKRDVTYFHKNAPYTYATVNDSKWKPVIRVQFYINLMYK